MAHSTSFGKVAGREEHHRKRQEVGLEEQRLVDPDDLLEWRRAGLALPEGQRNVLTSLKRSCRRSSLEFTRKRI